MAERRVSTSTELGKRQDRASKERDLRKNATKQTRAKLAKGTIGVLEDSGKITMDQAFAADLIEDGHHARTRPASLRMMGWTGVSIGGLYEPFTTHLTPREESAAKAYDSWCLYLEKRQKHAIIQLVIAVLCGDTLSKIQRRFGWTYRRVVKELSSGLQTYCDLNESFLRGRLGANDVSVRPPSTPANVPAAKSVVG